MDGSATVMMVCPSKPRAPHPSSNAAHHRRFLYTEAKLDPIYAPQPGLQLKTASWQRERVWHQRCWGPGTVLLSGCSQTHRHHQLGSLHSATGSAVRRETEQHGSSGTCGPMEATGPHLSNSAPPGAPGKNSPWHSWLTPGHSGIL